MTGGSNPLIGSLYMKRYSTRKSTLRYSSFTARRMERKGRQKLIIAIIITLVFGYFLITWFLPMLVGGLSFINTFKPKPKDILQISDQSTLAPPVLNIQYDATNSGTLNVKGYAAPHSKVEIYLDDEVVGTTEADSDGNFTSEPITLFLGTNNIFGKTLDENNTRSLPSKTAKLIYDSEKPKLELSQPQDNQTITGGDKKVTVSGKTDPTDTNILTVNGMRVILNSEGNFSQIVDLNDGENNVTVVATDYAGNSTQILRRVTYQP